MGQAGSAPMRGALPAWAGPLAAVLGFGAMWAILYFAAPTLGMRAKLLLAEAALVGPALLALALFRIPRAIALRLTALRGRALLLSLAAGSAFWVASLGLLELQSSLWPPDPGYLAGFRQLHEALRPHGAGDLLLSLAAIALVPALCEEVVLRGVVLPSLRPRLGAAGAVVASALLFALIHDPYRRPFTFVVGVGLGLLRVRSGSLTPPVVAHAALNTITFLAAWALDDPLLEMSDPRPLFGGALLALGLGASVLVLRASGVGGAATAASPDPR